MKRFYYLSVFALVAGFMSMFSVYVDANPKKIINSGNATAKGGNGGNANGTGAQGGNGGGAVAVSGGVNTGSKKKSGGTVANSGNATATGGNGGNANGKGAKGGNGGDAIAVSGNGNTVINGNNNTVIGKQVNNNISVNIGGGGGFSGFGGGFVTGGAFASGGFSGDGVIVGQPGAAIAVTPAATVVTTDGSSAVAVGQDGKDSDGEREEIFTRRYLKVKNDSGVPMKVYVQFRGMDDKKWSWMPADPSASTDALVYDLKVGEEMYLLHKDTKVAASRVRVWGMADGQSWLDFRDQDLWVVPEMDQRGEHRYTATEMKTFTFVFPKQMVK